MRRRFRTLSILPLFTLAILFGGSEIGLQRSPRDCRGQTVSTEPASASRLRTESEPAASLHIAEFTGISNDENGSDGRWSARFVVQVEDETETPVAGVKVMGLWTGVHAAAGAVHQTTDGQGRAVFQTRRLPIAGQTSLTVTRVSKTGYRYAARHNIASARTMSRVVPWTPTVRAEDWLITALDGHYAKVESSRGTLVQTATDDAGNPTHAVGDLMFRFPGAIPDGVYRLTVRWRTGAMGGTPWAFLLGTDGGRVTENGIPSGRWHYFYPGHSGSHSRQWFTHDLAGPNPVDLSMWPNSPIATSITISPTDPNIPSPDPNGTPIYVAFDTRVQPQRYPDQPAGFQDTPMVTFGGVTCPEGGPGAQHWKAYTAWNQDADPGMELLDFSGIGTTTFDHALPAGDYLVHAYWSANHWNNGDWVGLRFSGPGVTEHGTDDPGGLHQIYPPTTKGEPVKRDEIIGPSMGPGSTVLSAGKQPSYFPTGGRFGGSVFGTHLTLTRGNKVTFTVHDNNKTGAGNVFFYGLTFIPAVFPEPQNEPGVGQGDFYLRLRDMSPGRNNALSIESIALTPLGAERKTTKSSVETRLPTAPVGARRSTTTTTAAVAGKRRRSDSPIFPATPVGEKFTVGVYYAMPWLEPKDNFSWDYAFMDMARSGCNTVVISGNCWADQWAAIKHWGMKGITSYGQLNAYPGPGKWNPSDFVAGIQEQRERLTTFVWKGEYVGDAVAGHIMDDEPECRGLTEDKKNYLRAWADVYHQHNPTLAVYVNHCDPKWYDLNERHATCSTAPTIAVNSERITERIKASRTIGLKNFTVVALLGRLSDWSGQRAALIESWNLGRATPEVFGWLDSRTNYQDAYEQMITAYCYGSMGFQPYLYNQHRAVSLVDKHGNGQYGIRKGFRDAAHDLRRSHGWPGVTLSNNGSPIHDRGTYAAGRFTLTAQAVSDSGTITKVVFGKSTDGGSTWETSEDATAPFSVMFSSESNETVIFRARAVDADGRKSIYAANMIHVKTAPQP